MTEPIARFTEDEHIFSWPSMGIEINLTSFFEDRERNLHAMLSVHDLPRNGDEPSYFSRGRHNLTAPTSIERLATTLAVKCKEITKPAWQNMLSQACISAQMYWERGDPPVNVWEAEQLKETFLLDPLFPFGQVSMIFADGESGKSLLADTFGMAMQYGLPVPFPLRPLQQQINYLYLDWESDASEHRERLEWLARGWGYEPKDFPPAYHIAMARRLVDDLPRIRAAVKRFNIGFVVVDSIAAACGGIDLKEADATIRTLTALRLLTPVTSLVLAHTSKENASRDAGKGSAYGSVFFRNYVRRSWELRSHKNVDEGWLKLGLFRDKANWRPGLSEIGLRYEFSNIQQSVTLRSHNIKDDPILLGHSDLSTRIEHLLGDGKPRSKSEIASELGTDSRTTANCVDAGRGKKFEEVEKGSRGRGHEGKFALRAVGYDG